MLPLSQTCLNHEAILCERYHCVVFDAVKLVAIFLEKFPDIRIKALCLWRGKDQQ